MNLKGFQTEIEKKNKYNNSKTLKVKGEWIKT